MKQWRLSVVVSLAVLLAVFSALICQCYLLSKPASSATLHGPSALQHLKQTNQFDSLGAAYQAARYQIEAAPDATVWHSQNPAHRFTASFRYSTASDGRAGVQLQADRAQIGLQLRAIGYQGIDGRLLDVRSTFEARTENNRIEFQHVTESQSRVTEWFVNDANGLEHGFTLNEPIAPRDSQPLQLRLRINSELRAQADEQSVTWLNAEGEIVWRYAGLRVWDANGQTLAARMSLQADELTLSVDDATAVYPITIDPTFTLQRQLVAGPAADAFFGTAVALDGDTAVIGAEGEDFNGNDRQGAVYVFTRSGSLWTLQARLRAADGAGRDQLGREVAVLGDTLAASAPFHNIGAAADRGAVYVFTRSGGVWTQQQKLTANDGAANDFFGESLAIANNQLLIGAPFRNEANKTNSGAAYYFTRSGTTWSQTQKLLPSVGSVNDKFGESVAMVTGLNGALAIGAPGFESDGPANQGTVYIFLPVMGVWVASGQLFANDAGADDAYGSAVAISGGTLVIGAYLDDVTGITNAGSAYVYVRNGNAFTFQQKLLPNDVSAKHFGYAVSADGDTALIGARDDQINNNAQQGSAYVFVRNGTSWSQQQKLTSPGGVNDYFGQSVALDGNTALCGAPSENQNTVGDAGAAYVFTRNGTTWTTQQRLVGSDGEAGDSFGNAVALDGNTAVITAPNDDIGSANNQGSAYVFTRVATSWSLRQKLTFGSVGQGFGTAAALKGDTLLIGANSLTFNTGAVYAYTRDGNGVWTYQQTLTPQDSKANQFVGEEIALDDNVAVISAAGDTINGKTFQGAAYVFTRTNNTWTQSQKLTASDGEASDLFGSGVALDGNVIVIGAEGDTFGANANKGSAYIFERTNAGFTFLSKVSSVNGNADDRFGRSVSVSGTVIAIGAPLEDQNANTQQGAVHLYERIAVGWTFLQRITPATGAADDWFGSTVRLDGTVLAIASERDDVNAATNQGSVYVYERPAPLFQLTQQLTASDGAANDRFGGEIALDGATLLVGSPGNDVIGNANQGSAYVYVAPTCTFSLVTPGQGVAAAGGNGSVGLQSNLNTCTWQAVASDSWINISNKNGTGSATINFTVPANNGSARAGTINVAGLVFTVMQDSGCQYTAMPTTANFNAAGGNGAVNVTTTNVTCAWTAASNANWITLTSGTKYLGSGAVTYTVAANNGPQRTGTLTIAGFTITITQANGCTYQVDPNASSFVAAGGNGAATVQPSNAACAWASVSNAAWLTINTGANGTGNGTVTYTVTANSGAQRNGTLTIAGKTLTVTQAAQNQPVAPALSGINPNSVIAGAAALTATVTGSNFTANCRVQWNGQARDTSFVSATQLTVNLPATDFAAETIADITVFDFNTNQGSNPQQFRVFSPLASVSAASYSAVALAPESIVAGFGVQMATATQASNTIPLPTNLAGTTVRVIDSANVERLAPLFFVSAGQVNYLMPTGTALGKATVVITSSTNHVSVGNVEIALVTPGVFTANAQGNGTAAAQVLRVKPNGQLIYENVSMNGQPVPIDLTIAGDQVFLVLYGTGIRFRSNLNNVLLNVGGNNLTALYAGGTALEGLDQINAALPNTLNGKGEVNLALTVDGKQANVVRLTFK